MSSLDDDLTSILNCYVKRKSIGEIKFDEKQNESGLKICEQLIHEHSNKQNGKDKLKVITQLSHVSDNCDTPIASNEKMVFTSKENSPERNQNSPQISDYYLKSMILSHGKSKSLDNDHNRDLSDCHKTEITTVVGDSSSNYERVHNTTFIHSKKGNTIEKEHSFTRPVTSSMSLSYSRPSSYYSLPSQMNGNTLMPSTGKYKSHKKKLKKFKWKRFFSTSKSQKNKENLKDIDKLARQVNANLSATPKQERQDSKKTSLTLNISPGIPFKSHTIGEKLQPLCTKNMSKKIPDFFLSILKPQHFIPKSGSKNQNSENQTHTIDVDQIGYKKARRFVAQVSKQGENENFNYRINSNDLIDSPDGKDETDEQNLVFLPDTNNNRQRTTSENVSICHFDMMTTKVKERRPSCPNTRRIQCDCRKRRIELMVDMLQLCLNKQRDERILCQKKNEINDFDLTHWHFVDCDMMKILNEHNHTISPHDETLSQSLASLYSLNPCLHCNEDADEHLGRDVLPLLFEHVENEDEINCPKETIEYFLQATCYKHFEKGLLRIIGPHCTVKNVALLHYLTKRIVKHIGDPTEDDNKKIKKILKRSENFFLKHYYPHIKNIHKTMDSFLISCNDNEDVD